MSEKIYTGEEVENLINEIEKIKKGLRVSQKLARAADVVVQSSAMELSFNLRELKLVLEDFDCEIKNLGE